MRALFTILLPLVFTIGEAKAAISFLIDIEGYYQGYRDVAEARGLLLIDHYPQWLELYENDRALRDSYVPDGVHSNAVGIAAITLPGIQATLTAVPELSTSAAFGVISIAAFVAAGRRRVSAQTRLG